MLRDAIGRDWQCGTTQVDFNLPERFGAFYIDADGSKKAPVMVHRAICGSMERFIGILIEHFAGNFPLWLAPMQVVVTTITSEGDEYAKVVAAAARRAGLRVEIDLRNEKINYKVREHSLAKIPALLVVGKKEAETHSVSVRRLGSERPEGDADRGGARRAGRRGDAAGREAGKSGLRRKRVERIMFLLPHFHSSNQSIQLFALGRVGPGIHQSLYLFEGSAILEVRFDRSVHDRMLNAM